MKAAAGPRASPAKALVLWGSGAAAGPSGKWREYHPASSMSNPSFKESAARSFGQSASSLDLERCGVTIRVSEQWSCSTYLLLKDVACVTCSQVVISSLSCCRSYSLPTGCFFFALTTSTLSPSTSTLRLFPLWSERCCWIRCSIVCVGGQTHRST